jgi:hypothetical protein
MISRVFRKAVAIALTGAAVLSQGALHASPGPGPPQGLEVLEGITDAFSGITSIKSRFVQETHTAMLEEPLRSTGCFSYDAPDAVRWEVLSPERFGFSARGDRIRMWRGSGQEKEGAPPGAEKGVAQFLEQLLAWVRADFDWLDERFDISMLRRSPVELNLVPVSGAAAGRLERMRVVFSSDLNHLESIEILERNGDRIVITFLDVRVRRR